MVRKAKTPKLVEFNVPMAVDISEILDEDWFYEMVWDSVDNNPTLRKLLDKKVAETLATMTDTGEFDKLVAAAVKAKIKRIA